MSREDGELERWPSMKILRTNKPGWFAPWFELVKPDQTIHEDEYFWRTGQPLSPDNWTDDDQLDRYLGLNQPHEPAFIEDDENEADFPLTLSLDLSDDESEYDSTEVIRDDESVISSEFDYSLVASGPLDREFSDWSKMPPLLPKLPSAEAQLQPVELSREMSDWTQMPKVLPPLNEMSTLKPSSMQPQVSDWSLMPPLMAPLPSDPSQYHHVPNLVPMAPQISWETSDPQNVATPMWLKDNTNPNIHQNFMARPQGLEYAASKGVSQREMEILSDVPQPVMPAPVFYNGYGHGMPLQPTGVMGAPSFHSQPALVHFPFITLAGSII